MCQKAAEHLKRNYHCRVFIFGTLTRKDAFTDSSDIDIAIFGHSFDYYHDNWRRLSRASEKTYSRGAKKYEASQRFACSPD